MDLNIMLLSNNRGGSTLLVKRWDIDIPPEHLFEAHTVIDISISVSVLLIKTVCY